MTKWKNKRKIIIHLRDVLNIGEFTKEKEEKDESEKNNPISDGNGHDGNWMWYGSGRKQFGKSTEK